MNGRFGAKQVWYLAGMLMGALVVAAMAAGAVFVIAVVLKGAELPPQVYGVVKSAAGVAGVWYK